MNLLCDVLGNMRTKLFHCSSDIHVSFEFFPPQNDIFVNSNFLNSIEQLSVFKPKFISVTCTSRSHNSYDYTAHAIKHIPKTWNLNIAPHMIYIDSNKHEIQNLARNYWNYGIRHIVALRGDMRNEHSVSSVYASELILLLKNIADFDISVAAYPELHPECKNSYIDIINLKNKIDCGANRAITQFFFNVDNYLRFRDRCVSVGIDIDIIPGILPITNFQQITKFTNMTNVNIPTWIYNILLKIGLKTVGINNMFGLLISIDIINKLYNEGIRHFHFYTLNQLDIIYVLCCYLGVNMQQ